MKNRVFSGCFSSLLVYVVLMGFGFVSLPMIKQIVCFSGPQSPLRKIQKLNLQVSPHRAGIPSRVNSKLNALFMSLRAVSFCCWKD